jgi:hypothetical protein
MDGLLSIAPNCAQAVALPSSYSRTFNCTSKTTGWFTKGAEIETCPNKVLLQGSTFLYTLMDFFQSHQTVPKPLLSYLLPYSRTFNCTSKTLWFTKRLKLIPTCPTLTKCYSKVAHAFLYTLMDFFQSHQTVPNRCYLTFFHSRTFALVKRLAGSPKG